MKRLKRVVIMTGGTGGHVFPGLAVASYLRKQGIDVHWLGTRTGLEAKLVPDANFAFHTIAIAGLRGKGIKPLLSAPYKVSMAILQARRILNKINPDIVIGMGGFVSGPGGIASWLRRCPLIIHEQNAIAGTTNKLLAPMAKKVLLGFPNALKPQSKVITIGNPVRSEIECLAPPHERMHDRTSFHLLILGGSLGAQALNDVVPRALAKMAEKDRPLVLHQTGDKHIDNTKNTYQSLGISATVKPFLDDMAEAYAWADLVICRAGALTVSELCNVGLGAIFIPFPYATDDHQTANANYMVKNKAAICVPQKALTVNRLFELIQQFTQSKHECQAMANAAFALRKVQVAAKFFDILTEVVSMEKERDS